MPEALMTLRYEGDAVDAGTMEVRQLAPALLAAGEAIRQAHALLGIPGPAPQVEVHATRPGSFIVELLVADLPLLRRAIDLLASTGPTAASNLIALVSAVIASFSVVKGLAGRKITGTEEVEPGLIRLTLENGIVIEVSPESLQLALDVAYRRSVRRMIKPVADNDGIRSLTVSADTQSETVAVADIPAFEIPALTEEDLGESEVVLRPVNVAFMEGNKWRFNDGETTFHASIEDAGFLGAVEAGSERFAKNDLLRVRLRIRQTRDAEGALHTERAITGVLEHLRAPVGIQLALFTDIGERPKARHHAPKHPPREPEQLPSQTPRPSDLSPFDSEKRGGQAGDRRAHWYGSARVHIADHGLAVIPFFAKGHAACPRLEREGCGYPAWVFRWVVRVR